jgi:hypothetical protein
VSHHAAAIDTQHVRDATRKFVRMRDRQQQVNVTPPDQVFQEALQMNAKPGIESGKDVVQNQESGPAQQRVRQQRLAHLATRQRREVSIHQLRDPQPVQNQSPPPGEFGGRSPTRRLTPSNTNRDRRASIAVKTHDPREWTLTVSENGGRPPAGGRGFAESCEATEQPVSVSRTGI